ncbi:uncharacterized protein LOC131312351 [Rhododendron vialii]|uniref:uncharacterized protein LOC131312351 n=1 Tax=Rhododendron vialii TaxID=182163 RepID=UPI00265FDC0C|nr:uncharacterized protein LOC131312351 [Rhododendron vialii]
MSRNGKTSVVGIWTGLMILCLVVGETSAISCSLKCALRCGFIFLNCIEQCEIDEKCTSSSSVVSTVASRCAFTCTKEKCVKFAPNSKEIEVCAQSCADDCHFKEY